MKNGKSFLVLCGFGLNSCVYPVPTTQYVSFDTLPPAVIARIGELYPHGKVETARRYEFRNKVVQYEITMADKQTLKFVPIEGGGWKGTVVKSD